MRTDFSENAISAKVHALYGRRIVRSQYEELCRKHTTSEIAAYLKERTHLTEVLNTVQPATVRSDQLESILHKGRYNKYLDLVKYATPKTREFYRSYVLNLAEIQLILQMIRLINIGRTSEIIVSYPAFAESDLRIGLGKLSKVKTYDELLEALEGTEYHDPLLRYRSTDKKNPVINYAGCEMDRRNDYYEKLKAIVSRTFSGETRREIDDIMATKIALENGIIGYRLKKYYPDMTPEDIKGYMLDFWREPPMKLLDTALRAKTAEDYLNTLKNGRYIAGIGDGEIHSIGLGSQAIRSLLSQRYMRRTQQPAVAFVCYMFHSEMEIDNIVRIVEAVRYGMDPSEIMQLLVII